MSVEFRAEGETWRLGLEDEHSPLPGAAALVFHCVSNPQRPYRVLPVSADEPVFRAARDERIPEERLRELFSRSQVMDFTRDPEADPRRDHYDTTP